MVIDAEMNILKSFLIFLLFIFLAPNCSATIEVKTVLNHRVIPVDNEIVRMSQGATVVNGKLWIAYDDYKGNTCFYIFNIDTGREERIVRHNLSHCNSMDYNAETDVLLLPLDQPNHRSIVLYPNVSQVSTVMDIEDAIVIPIDSTVGSLCWGEDDSTIYQILMWDDTVNENKYSIRKITLGKDDGFYNGTYSISKVYSGEVLDGYDTRFGPSNINYAQGCDYDGNIYLGYGTSGHNFLVISLYDATNRYEVIGNYYWKFYDADDKEYYLEPEFVALSDDDKLILGSRNYNSRKTAVLEFDKSTNALFEKSRSVIVNNTDGSL